MKIFNKSRPRVNINQDEFELAKAASLKLTRTQFITLCKVVKSEVYYPGLIAYYDYMSNY